MSDKKKEYKPIEFIVKDGEQKGKYAINCEEFYIPNVGKVAAADLAKDADMLTYLIGINSGIITKFEK